MMKKKGSLNLSIEAIVIIVIAFVVLGLGLGFVRGIFEKSSTQTEDTFAVVKENLKASLQKSNDPLYFPQDKVSLSSSEEKVLGLGVKNTGDFALNLKVLFQVRIGETFIEFKPGTVDTFGTGDASFHAGIDWDSSLQKYVPGQSVPIPFTITAPDKFGNYLYKIKVVKDDGSDYASKTFFVRTS